MTQFTPVFNWPYPEAGDAPRGNEQIQALAEAIEHSLTSDWYDIPLMDGYVPDSDAYKPQYRIAGSRVELRGIINPASGAFGSTSSAQSYQFWENLPDEILPARGFARSTVAMSSNATPHVHYVDVSRAGKYMRLRMCRLHYGSSTWCDLTDVNWPLATEDNA